MDLRAASIVANVVGLAAWCEVTAQEIDVFHAASEHRPLSPVECRRLASIHRESLRRMGQHHILMLTLYTPETRVSPSAPPALLPPAIGERAPWWRQWLRRVVG